MRRKPLTRQELARRVLAFSEEAIEQAIETLQYCEPEDMTRFDLEVFYRAARHIVQILANSQEQFMLDHDAVAALESMPDGLPVN